MPAKDLRAKETSRPWWLGAGTERCSCCGETHAHHAEYRCEGCDRSLCGCCASGRFNHPVLCSECKAAEKPARRARS